VSLPHTAAPRSCTRSAKIQERLGRGDRAHAARERAEHARERHAKALREQAEADERAAKWDDR
jgi:hypothetical protein